MPASSASLAKAKAENGVSLAGFNTMVQPAASAGAALRVIIAKGKFHGVMAATTPMASLLTNNCLSGLGEGITSPYTRLPSSANHCTNEAAYLTSPKASLKGLPCSKVINSANSSACLSIKSYQRSNTSARCWAVRFCHGAKAAWAALTACSAAAVPKLGT